MNTRKLLVAIIFLSSTQLAFASSSIDNLTQKNQQKILKSHKSMLRVIINQYRKL